MVSRVQNIRSTNKNTRPPNTTRQPGEFYVNFADKQFGVIDTSQVPQDLIAIRFHSPDTDYAIGDHVLYNGRAYRAKQAIPASVFNPTYWETAGMADAPPDNKFYGRVNNAWDIPEIADVYQLQASLDAKAPLVSPAFASTPTAPTAPAATNTAQLATTAFVKSQNYATIGGAELLAKVSIAGDTMTGPLTLNATPTVPLHAATKAYVDAKPSGASTNDIPPTAPVNGQMWWETDTGSLFIFYDDGNSQAWVQLNASTVDAYNKSQSDLKYVDVAGDTMSGALAINNATASTSATTGALIVAGGVGVNGGIACGGFGIGVAPATSAGWGNSTSGVSIGTSNCIFSSNPTGGLPNLSLNRNSAGTEASFNYNGGAVGSISITTTATAYNTSSSAELKEDLKSFDAGNIIDDTEIYDFKWKDTTERSYGIIAQQAVEVYPQAITHDEEQDWWGVDYSKYVPVILQELKTLRARVAELEGEKAPIAPKRRS